ncbi:hypothetical protein C8046_04925 [Serinibacter arcticus]|uniref:ADP-dependent glucokinase n=1 Tax=Serinibacter arcticus TaxID=1655435 RepID=A0A2U1ZT30_9MICO|nr:ADP-dependent glucokinase/phosphofructokinase [Serinibacter arcticus]PWD50110.1 hypothetical protein C8046_04925 [Serinibacter arcticus]
MHHGSTATVARTEAERIVLGLGGTVDVEVVWDAQALGAAARELGVGVGDLDAHREIVDERSLLAVLLALVAAGRGGERFAASSDLVRAFATRFTSVVTLGGTNIRAALAMAVLDVPATIHMVDVDATVRRLVPPGSVLLHTGVSEALDPHLIVQFPAGARVELTDGVVVAPHANRFIVTNDPPNRLLTLAPGLADAVERADVVMLSTLNAIQEREILAERLVELERVVTHRRADALVLWEEAAYHVPHVRDEVSAVLAAIADVYSMNEDELEAFVGRGVDLLDADDVSAALDELAAVVPARTLVVHASCWALAVGERAHELRAALRGGITMASTRYVHGDAMTRADHDATAALVPRADAVELARALERRRSDVAVEAGHRFDVDHPTTIGLGDSFIGGFVAALALAPAGPAAHPVAPDVAAHGRQVDA